MITNSSTIHENAPGEPGVRPTWCPGNKQLVGTSLGPSRVWFTIGQGIVNEVYFPRIDIPQLRDLGFIICNQQGLWVEIKSLHQCIVECEPGSCSAKITHQHEHFKLIQRIAPEPDRDVLLIEVTLIGDDSLELFMLAAPHLGGSGSNNSGAMKSAGKRVLLTAQQGPFAMAIAAINTKNQHDAISMPSIGYCGSSDLWQQFNTNSYPKDTYLNAGPGNIALSARLPQSSCIAIGFANGSEAAGTLAISSLLQPFEDIWCKHLDQWRQWQLNTFCPTTTFLGEQLPRTVCDQLKVSAMVLKTHFDQTFRGAMVASLSVPWGSFADERPGYHLVWPRDLSECAGAFLAIGAQTEAREILRYLIATQKSDGSWHQNQWLGGTPFWTNLQLDQVAFPVLLAGMIADNNALNEIYVADMVISALKFIVSHGPISPQDRWEESSGTNPFTLSVVIAALVSGARFLPEADQVWALNTADYWNSRLEEWTAVKQSKFTNEFGLDSHYVKVVPDYAIENPALMQAPLAIKNRIEDFQVAAADQIACDFLQLVRFGIRSSDYPTIKNTLLLIDETLKINFPQGPCWYRYTLDGYGEHQDATPYNETGIGRPWPLLTGERGHYELCANNSALPLINAMTNMATGCGMLPEQLWDNPDLETEQLHFSKESGSATPLAWAHAEYIKLVHSSVIGAPIDRPSPVWDRYKGIKPDIDFKIWSTNTPFLSIAIDKKLFVQKTENQSLTVEGCTLPEPVIALGSCYYDLTSAIATQRTLKLIISENNISKTYTVSLYQV